jgi:hypothetical protein
VCLSRYQFTMYFLYMVLIFFKRSKIYVTMSTLIDQCFARYQGVTRYQVVAVYVLHMHLICTRGEQIYVTTLALIVSHEVVLHVC